MALVTARSKFYFYNTMVCLLKALEGKRIKVEIRGNVVIVGKLELAESTMALNLTNVVYTDVRKRQKNYDKFYIKGRQIVFVHIPDEIDMIAAMKWEINKTDYYQEQEKKDRNKIFDRKKMMQERSRERNEKKEARQKEHGGPQQQRQSSLQGRSQSQQQRPPFGAGRATSRQVESSGTQGRHSTCSVDRGMAMRQHMAGADNMTGDKKECLQAVKDFFHAQQGQGQKVEDQGISRGKQGIKGQGCKKGQNTSGSTVRVSKVEGQSGSTVRVPKVEGQSGSTVRVPTVKGQSGSTVRVPTVEGQSGSTVRVPKAKGKEHAEENSGRRGDKELKQETKEEMQSGGHGGHGRPKNREGRSDSGSGGQRKKAGVRDAKKEDK